jgi:myo-inositol 2-dehydrogenase/D-chiro-inositol 1-dehydrogenase
VSSELGVGVIGAGAMGARHAANIHTHLGGARLVAVMDIDTDRAVQVAAPAGAAVFTDAEALIASDTVDAVIVASPDQTHAALALTCLARRKPSLVEKPLAVDLEDAATIVERETNLGQRLVQVGLMRHYDPQHVGVKATLDAGTVGRPLMFRGWHRNPPEAVPPTSAAVLITSAIHDLYSAHWLLDQEVAEIYVQGTTIDPHRTDQLDLQLITMAMSDGALATVEVNKDSGFGYEVGVEITGSEGIVSTPPHHTPVVRYEGAMRQQVEPDWLERFTLAYILEVQAWIAAVATGRAEGPSAWDGYLTLAAALAGADSIERSTPIQV